MTPTENLVLEVLGARYRLGEHLWTFDSANARAIRSLSGRGLVMEMGGVTEKTVRASLTDAGRAYVLRGEYTPPTPPPPARVYVLDYDYGRANGPFVAVPTVGDADTLTRHLQELVPHRTYGFTEVPVAAELETIEWWEARGRGAFMVLEPSIERIVEHQYGPNFETAQAVPETVEVINDGLSRPQYGEREIWIRGRDETAVRAATVAAVEKVRAQKIELGKYW